MGLIALCTLVFGCSAPREEPESPESALQVSAERGLALKLIRNIASEGVLRDVATGRQAPRDTAPVLFTDIRGVCEDSLGRIYVLDAASRQVFVFDSLGSAVGNIGKGYGEGPGSFVYPLMMAVSPSGDVAVGDIGTRRITVFDRSGLLSWTAPVGEVGMPAGVAFADSGLYVRVVRGSRTDSLVGLLSREGEFTEWWAVGDTHQRALERGGQLGVLAPSLSGREALFFLPYPFRWAKIGAGVRWAGSDLSPELAVEQEAAESGPPLSFVRTGILGAGQLSEKQFWVLAFRHGPGTPRDPANRWLELTVLNQGGDIGEMTRVDSVLPGATRVFPSRRSGRLFVVLTEPSPHVVEVEVAEEMKVAMRTRRP